MTVKTKTRHFVLRVPNPHDVDALPCVALVSVEPGGGLLGRLLKLHAAVTGVAKKLGKEFTDCTLSVQDHSPTFLSGEEAVGEILGKRSSLRLFEEDAYCIEVSARAANRLMVAQAPLGVRKGYCILRADSQGFSWEMGPKHAEDCPCYTEVLPIELLKGEE